MEIRNKYFLVTEHLNNNGKEELKLYPEFTDLILDKGEIDKLIASLSCIREYLYE